MMDSDRLRKYFDAAVEYDAYVRTGTPDQQASWSRFHALAGLTAAEKTLVQGFTRAMNVLVISGVWCGDCVQQVPFLAHIAAANPDRIHARYIDRDVHPELSASFKICGGLRVPVVILMAEDFEFCGLAGDRTLARYRALAARQLGPSCPLPGAPVPPDEVAATRADWVAEFERVQLMLRLSGRLRKLHDD